METRTIVLQADAELQQILLSVKNGIGSAHPTVSIDVLTKLTRYPEQPI